MRRWIFRDRARARNFWLPIAALLYFAGALAQERASAIYHSFGIRCTVSY